VNAAANKGMNNRLENRGRGRSTDGSQVVVA